MKAAIEFKERGEQLAAKHRGERKRRVLPLVVLLLFSLCAALLLLIGRRASAETNQEAITNRESIKTSPVFFKANFAKPPQDYSKFRHSYPGQHAALTGRNNCSSCHQRRDNSITPTFPGHKDCDKCHQFTLAPFNPTACLICHTQEGLNQGPTQQNPYLKSFPNSLVEFNAEFDHAEHINGPADARPQKSCQQCHLPVRRGVALTAPSGLAAHLTCYVCHTPGRQAGGADIGNCGECHAPGRGLVRIATVARSYNLGFSHAEHGLRQRLNCESCHTILQRGLAEGKQVSLPTPAEHFPNTRAVTCATCHNNQRSFGEANFNDCKRCHTGQTFR
jgi:hypothetical protein